MSHISANQSQFSFVFKELNNLCSVDAFKISYQSFSEDYEIKLWMRTSSPLTLATLLSQTALFTLYGQIENNFFHGVITAAQSRGQTPDGQEYIYEIVLNSPLSLLKLNQNNQVFLNKSVIDIVTSILQNAGWLTSQFHFQLQKTYPTRECIIQANETDYDFLWRLLTFWGLFFTWSQQEETYQLFITDNIQECNAITTPQTLVYAPLTGTVRPTASLFSLQDHRQVLAKGVQLRDYNPNTPAISLEFSSTQQTNLSTPAVGIEDRYGEHIVSPEEGELLIQVRQQALDWQRNTFTFQSDCPTLHVGQLLTMTCSYQRYNRSYHIIKITHYGDQSAGKIYANEMMFKDTQRDPLTAIFPGTAFDPPTEENPFPPSLTYYNELLCIPVDIPYRTYLPMAFRSHQGFMTATIESADDSPYAYLDESGSYRIRFPFDESNTPNGQASPPVRMGQPYSGENFGWHFPLRAGTQVLLAFENGDIDRPIIMGVIPNPNNPSPVTAQNAPQNILRTQSGHTLLMDDTDGQNQTSLSTRDQQHQLLLDATDGAHQIVLATQQGKMQLQAKQTFTTTTQSDYQQQIGNNHYVTIQNQHQVTTQQGDIQLQAGRDLKLKANNTIQMQAQQNMVLQGGQNTILNIGQGATIQSSEGDINISTPNGSFILQANQGISIGALGQGDITIAQAGAMVQIKADGSITAQANQINFYSQQHNLTGNQAHLGGQGQAAPSPKPQLPTEIKLIYQYANGSQQTPAANVSSDGMRQNTLPWPVPMSDAQGQSTVANLNQGEQLTLQNSGAPDADNNLQALAIVAINQQKRSPWDKLQLNIPDSPNQGQTPDAQHTFHLTAIRPPVIKDYTNYVNQNSTVIPTLTADEINYFQSNGNNATIFIHGFNVEQGYFGEGVANVQITEAEVPGLDQPTLVQEVIATTDNCQCTLLRMFEEFQAQFPQIPPTTSTINNQDLETFLNGAEAHNWLLHMEYNLNCAASGNYPFDWQAHGLDYTRIINVIWPGDVGMLEYLNAEDPAYKTGIALMQLILQLQQSGITINVIAHSLGSKLFSRLCKH